MVAHYRLCTNTYAYHASVILRESPICKHYYITSTHRVHTYVCPRVDWCMHLPCAVSHAAVPRHSGPGRTVGHRSFGRWLRASASWWRDHCEGTYLALHLPRQCHHTIPTVPYYPSERIGARSRWCVCSEVHTYNTAMNQDPSTHELYNSNKSTSMHVHTYTQAHMNHSHYAPPPPSTAHTPTLCKTQTHSTACVQYQNGPQTVLSWPGSDWQVVALCLHQRRREHCGSK